MKYIDADRLRAKIENYLATDKSIDTDFYKGRSNAEGCILALIDTLQQEQDIPVITKKVWEAQEKFRKNKKFGVPVQQEQPEVDFEIGKYMTTNLLKKRNHSTGIFHLTEKDYATIANHFYELGLNARKENKHERD